jgi:hypothetical protein
VGATVVLDRVGNLLAALARRRSRPVHRLEPEDRTMIDTADLVAFAGLLLFAGLWVIYR